MYTIHEMILSVSNNNPAHYDNALIFLQRLCGLVTERSDVISIVKHSGYLVDPSSPVNDELITVPVLEEDGKRYECVYNDQPLVVWEDRDDAPRVLFRSKIAVVPTKLHIDFGDVNISFAKRFYADAASFARNEYRHVEPDTISHYVFANYCEWEKSDTYNKRDPSTLHLPAHTKEALLTDVDRFYRDEGVAQFYRKMGVAQTRIYLFYGYPGTGKTTTSFVIASKLKLNICTLDFTSNVDDYMFRKGVKSLPDDSLLLIEDIDHLFCPKKDKDDLRHSITFTGLLNVLDGVSKVKRLICIITCNDIGVLDATLLRRMDYSVEFKNEVTEDQLHSFCKTLSLDVDTPQFVRFFKNKSTTMNIIQKWVLHHLPNLLMNKYTLMDKLHEFNEYSKWFNTAYVKSNMYN